MKPRKGCLARVEPQRLWSAVLGGCLLVPLVFLVVLLPSLQPLSFLNFQALVTGGDRKTAAFLAGNATASPRDFEELSEAVTLGGAAPPPVQQTNSSWLPDKDLTEPPEENAAPPPPLPVQQTNSSWLPDEDITKSPEEDAAAAAPPLSVQQTNSSWLSGEDLTKPPLDQQIDSSFQSPEDLTRPPKEDAGESPPSTGDNGAPPPSANVSVLLPQEEEASKAPATRIECDYSPVRTDVCELYGEVRIQGSSFSVFAVAAGGGGGGSSNSNSSWKIRPYARKWETALMPNIKEYTVRAAAAPPACSVSHSVPAVVFSTGGLLGNFFHDLSDVLIPLFLTSSRYNGEVQFVVTQYRTSWFEKYRAVLRRLSKYKVIDADSEERVHCFRRATVGLWSHQELGINPAQHPTGFSMADFRQLLRSAYSLPREFPRRLGTGTKPRMLFLSRTKSRALLNQRAVAALARELGFKVIVAAPEAARDMPKFAKTVNSCDLLMGVHGAGLTNMVFLPTNATMLQVIPWGELKYACRFAYGDPALGMGLRYLEYEVGMEETSLKDQYPRDHAVFRDPLSIHRQGFPVVWSIFIDHQNVTIDVDRFRPFLLETLRFLRQ